MQKLKEAGHTIVVAEHRLYYLAGLFDRLIYMQNGNIRKEIFHDSFMLLSQKELTSLGLRSNNIASLSAKRSKNKEMKPTISISNLSFAYKKNKILENLNWIIGKGEIIALVGENGVGKTTIARLLCGLIKEKSGMIEFAGSEIKKRKRMKKAYYVMQDTDCQLFTESVSEELTSGTEDNSNIDEILKKYMLLDYKARHPASLSGGQKQRLTLAVAEIIDRDILILDEPTSGLDGANMRRIAGIIKELSEQGKTIIVITHDYEFILSCCSRVSIMKDRTIIENISVEKGMENQIREVMEGKLYY